MAATAILTRLNVPRRVVTILEGESLVNDATALVLYRAAVNADRGLPSAEETAIAKAYCNQAGFEICSEAMQVMGGMGYSQESLVEYCVRRTRGWMIAGGSIEILKNRIAEAVFERGFSQRPAR